MSEVQKFNILTFSDIIRGAFSNWLLHFFSGVIMLSVAVLFLYIIDPKYEATATIAPTLELDDDKASLGSLNSPLSLLSLNKTAPMTGFEQVLVVLKSNLLASRLFNDEKIKNYVFGFDPASNTYSIQRSKLQEYIIIINEFFNRPTVIEPTVMDLRKEILGRLTIVTSRESVAVTLRFKAKSTEMAAYILGKLLVEAAVLVKAARLNAYQQYVTYLGSKLEVERVNEHRQILAKLLARYERQLTFVLGSQLYGVLLVDPVVASTRADPCPVMSLMDRWPESFNPSSFPNPGWTGCWPGSS